ncbi:hypothetical protein [Dyadobacter frigoris]|uniref:Uncharacterized protein n=1 Tax=Dyadobacter frigoris TaxID=2576211 RepID=A0A4U6CZ35_9BACT|nr:hypothetical protein [Dyadobacter frigoris]TKT88618.1 hypothetical protein FDK13_27115 [Dyadobacter frigoris]GLU54952.1 hypothetical protein Dfri01_44130 [Dyadobacter frigoris]
MRKSNYFFFALLLTLSILLFNSCQKQEPEPDPIIKETIEGDIQNLQLNIYSGSVDFLSFDLVDSKDKKVYSIGMNKAASFSDYNATAYIDSSNLILAETTIQTLVSQPDYISVAPIQSTKNQIYIDYQVGSKDNIYKTTKIIGTITEKTILTVLDTQANTKEYRLFNGIQKYLVPNLHKAINKNLGVNGSVQGSQAGKYFVYDIGERQ